MPSIAASMLMSKRDVAATALNAASDAKIAFSSPSQCVKYNICKIPLIVGCVVAAMILLSCVCYFAACMRCLSCLCCCNTCATASSRGSRRGASSRHYEPPSEMSYKPQAPVSYFSYAPNQQVGTTPLPAHDPERKIYEPVNSNHNQTQIPQTPGQAPAYTQQDHYYESNMPQYPSYQGGQAYSYYNRQ